MAGFSLEATLLLPDQDNMDTLIEKFAEDQMRKAAKVFLKACLDRIPIRTGFLRGAFREINRYFEYNDTANFGPTLSKVFKEYDAHRQRLARMAKKTFKEIAAHEAVFAKQIKSSLSAYHAAQLRKSKSFKNKTSGEIYYDGADRILKDPVSGIPYAIPPGDIITKVGNQIVFNIYVNIIYYNINDNYSHGRGTPWNSLQAGVDAMVFELRKGAKKFPNLLEKSSKIKISMRDTGTTILKIPGGS